MKQLIIILLSCVLLSMSQDLMAQCAMCRGTVESTVSGGRSLVASNLNIGILYLLLAPYLAVSTIAFLWYRKSKKEHGQRLEITNRVKRAITSL